MKFVLIDSNVWVDHLRDPNPQVLALARDDRILGHPLICAELAVGSLKNREAALKRLDRMIMIRQVALPQVRILIENEELFSKRIGVIDATLLACCLVHGSSFLWTRDRRLNTIAERFGIAYQPLH